MHNARLARHGDPLFVKRKIRPKGEIQTILQNAASSDTDECIFFPMENNRFRTVSLGRKSMTASRAVWILANGEISEGGHVLHTCNKGGGGNGCINPRHLYLGTNADNARDTLHAGRRFWAVLTPENVMEIRRVGVIGKHRGNTLELAERYGVKPRTIRNILNGKSWTSL